MHLAAPSSSAKANSFSSTGSISHFYLGVAIPEMRLPTLLEFLNVVPNSNLSALVVCTTRDAVDQVARGIIDLDKMHMSCLVADYSEQEKSAIVKLFTSGQGYQYTPSALRQSDQGKLDIDHQDRSIDIAQMRLSGQSPLQWEQQGMAQLAERSADAAPRRESWLEEEYEQQERLLRLQRQSSLLSKRVLVCTDAALRQLPRDIRSLKADLLVHFDLPPSKDALQRRHQVAFGGNKERQQRASNCIGVHVVVAGQLEQFRVVEGMINGDVNEMPLALGELFS